MMSVLHVPFGWKKQWNHIINKVKANSAFQKHNEEYLRQCEQRGSLEVPFYIPLANSLNAILDTASLSLSKGPGSPQRWFVNHPKKLSGGVLNKTSLSPDLVVRHDELNSKTAEFHWANILHVLEVKPYDSALCDGTNLPRLLVNCKPVASFFLG